MDEFKKEQALKLLTQIQWMFFKYKLEDASQYEFEDLQAWVEESGENLKKAIDILRE